MDLARTRQECVRIPSRRAERADDWDMADDQDADPVPAPRGRAWQPHGPADTFWLDPDVTTVLRLVVIALALWALLAVPR